MTDGLAILSDVKDRTFDYLIAGGGTAGLTLAARLSEDPNVTVAVLEAGQANLNDPNILIPGQFGKTFGNPQYDWGFQTTKQPHCNDRVAFWPRGKGLGGSSAINFYMWSKPPANDVDAWEKLGNTGWNWDSYSKYTKRSETFHKPTADQLSFYPHTFKAQNRGTDGPIQTSFSHLVHTLDEPFHKTMINMGFKAIEDPYGGDITGTFIASASIDPKTSTRSYAATAHYLPNKDRKNLTVLTEATVVRVLFADSNAATPNNDLVATGLEFRSGPESADRHVVHARKEVILSTGSIRNPQVLELSGIGREDVLAKLGVDVRISLPGVGENVQEHLHTILTFELNDKITHETLDLLHNPAYAAEQMKLHAKNKGMFRVGITSTAFLPLSKAIPTEAASMIASLSRSIEAEKASGKLPPGLAEQLDLQLQRLKDDTLPDFQLIVFPGFFALSDVPADPKKTYVTLVLVNNHPLSRGTIHAVSRDPTQQPEIDPHHFENDFDLELLVQQLKFGRAVTDVEPWKSLVVREVEPGSKCTSEEDIRNFIKNHNATMGHTTSSCSMLPRDKQGVVDSNLKVYGTQNLRVVDVSIVPLHVSAHMLATAYVIAEKAADIIRQRS